MSEVLYQQHDFLFLQQSDGLPLTSPFKKAPQSSDIVKERLITCNASTFRSSILFFDSPHAVSEVQSSCLKCSRTACIPVERCAYFHYRTLSALTKNAEGPRTHALILSDCSNTAIAVRQGNHRTDEKFYRVICAYLKDFLRFLSVSYCNAAFNMSDTGTKRSPTAQIWRNFRSTGVFKMGFLSRKECKTLLLQELHCLDFWCLDSSVTWVRHLKGIE